MASEVDEQYDDRSEGYPPDWEDRRLRVLRRDGYRCQHCRIRSTRVDDISLDVDHIVPKSKGGTHEISNLRALCPECHSNRHPENDTLNNRSNKWSGGFISDLWNLLYRNILSDTGSCSVDQAGRVLQFDPIETIPDMDEDRAVSFRGRVVDLWDRSSEKIFQTGILVPSMHADGELEAPIRFVSWEDADVRRIHEQAHYAFIGARTTKYDGEIQISIDNRTEIIPAALL